MNEIPYVVPETGDVDVAFSYWQEKGDTISPYDNTKKIGLGTDTAETKVEVNDTAPYQTFYNTTPSDAEQARKSRVIYKGTQSGGEKSTLAYLEASHKGTLDDQRGAYRIFVNKGTEGDSPTVSMEINKTNTAGNFNFYAPDGTGFTMAIADRAYFGGKNVQFQSKPFLFTSTTGAAAMNIPQGVTPTSPSAGDVWHNSDGLLFRFGSENRYLHHKDEVIINSIDDFPTKGLSGYITLENKHYIIMNSIILDGNAGYYGFYIEPDDSPQITGYRSIGYINQNGSDALFRSDDLGTGLLVIDQLNVYSDGSGKLFQIASNDPTQSFFLINTLSAGGFYSLGSVRDVSYYASIVEFVQNVAVGLTLQDNNAIAVNLHRFYNWYDYAATFITIKGSNGPIQISNTFFQPQSTEFCLNIDPTSTELIGSVVDCAFELSSGGGTALYPGSKDHTDINWTWAANPRGETSTVTVQALYDVSVALTTTIPAINAKVIINATPWTSSDLERMSLNTTTGIATYTGLEEVKIALDGNVELSPALGTNQNVRAGFFVVYEPDYSATFNNINDTVTFGTSVSNGTIISFKNTGGTLPAALRTDVFYYVVNSAGTVFQLSYTLGGAVVTFADDGSGTNTGSIAVVSLRAASETLSVSTLKDLIPQALIEITTGDEIGVFVSNATSTNGVNCKSAYYRIKK